MLAFYLGWILAGRSLQGGQPGDKGEKPALKGWTKGKGWGPWSKDDEVGALNAMTPVGMGQRSSVDFYEVVVQNLS